MASTDIVELQTTVASHTSGSNTLVLNDVTGLANGDSIIITKPSHTLGGEGVDGYWTITNLGDFAGGGNYYLNVAGVAKAWIGNIVGIAGTTLTLARAVPSDATGMVVYRNNMTAVKHYIENAIAFPSGKTLAVAREDSGGIVTYVDPNVPHEIDFNGCTLFAPEACGPMNLVIAAIGGGFPDDITIHNGTLKGNARSTGYGLSVTTGAYNQGTSFITALGIAGRNWHVYDMTFIDNWRSVVASYAYDFLVENCVARFTDVLHNYIQWEFLTNYAVRGVFDRCTLESDYERAFCSAFKSQDIAFTRCGGTNAPMEINTSGRCMYKDYSNVWTVSSPGGSWSINTPQMTMSRTIEVQQGVVQPNTDGGTLLLDCSLEYRAIPYSTENRVNWCITSGGGVRGINTELRVFNQTYINPFNTTTTGGNVFGYVLNGDVNAQDTVFGGTNDLSTLDTPTPYGVGGVARTPNETDTESGAPTITTGPVAQVVASGSGVKASFTCRATGGFGMAYQWQVNEGSGWINVSTGNGGVDSWMYTTEELLDTSRNGHQYRCVVTNHDGTVTSDAVLLSVS